MGKNMLCLVLGAALAGCAGKNPPPRYYLLEPLAERVERSASVKVLGIGPVSLRRYLNRNEIVTGKADGELEFAELDRWAEPLQDNITQVLAENLDHLIHPEQVLLYPWPRARSVDVQAEVEIVRFHAEADGTVALQARWGLYRGDALLRAGESDIRVATDGTGYGALAHRQSEALAALSREIAAALPH